MTEFRPPAARGDAAEITAVEPPRRGPVQIALKRLVQLFFLGWIAPRLLVYAVSRRILGRERAFGAASEGVAGIPGARGVYCRQAFYRRTLAACGRDVYFGWGSVFSKPGARVGEGAYIGRRCGIGLADIGPGTMLADGVQVLSGGRQHGLATESGRAHRDEPRRFTRVRIGAGAWLGTNAIVMADVGEGAVVGAGAVVRRPIPPRTLAVGVPAEVVRKLAPDEPAPEPGAGPDRSP